MTTNEDLNIKASNPVDMVNLLTKFFSTPQLEFDQQTNKISLQWDLKPANPASPDFHSLLALLNSIKSRTSLSNFNSSTSSSPTSSSPKTQQISAKVTNDGLHLSGLTPVECREEADSPVTEIEDENFLIQHNLQRCLQQIIVQQQHNMKVQQEQQQKQIVANQIGQLSLFQKMVQSGAPSQVLEYF